MRLSWNSCGPLLLPQLVVHFQCVQSCGSTVILTSFNSLCGDRVERWLELGPISSVLFTVGIRARRSDSSCQELVMYIGRKQLTGSSKF